MKKILMSEELGEYGSRIIFAFGIPLVFSVLLWEFHWEYILGMGLLILLSMGWFWPRD